MTVLGWVGEKGTRVATLPLENAGILRCAQNDDVKQQQQQQQQKQEQEQEQGQGQKQQQQQRQKQEQRRNTGISPLRRQSAPPSVEMTFVRGLKENKQPQEQGQEQGQEQRQEQELAGKVCTFPP